MKTTNDLVNLEWTSALMRCLSMDLDYAQVREDISPDLLATLISDAVDEAMAIAKIANATTSTLYELDDYDDLLASMALHDHPKMMMNRALARGTSLEEAQKETELRIETLELIPHVTHFTQLQDVTSDFFRTLSNILTDETSPERTLTQLFGIGER